ncbi:MAG: glycosyltransferase family 4 protein [Candidatus Dojkabacteria bacterium]|nr:glycosyltransferase family 4 protein [Candidatus Dojkabacteria bacterium]
MKIAQICPYNFLRSGGVQSHIEYLSSELRDRGHAVKIIAPGVKGTTSKRNDLILLGSSNELPWADTRIELSIALGKRRKALKEILEKEKFDIIHFHEPWIPVLSMQILAESKSINVATFHAANRKNILIQSFATLVMPIASSVVNLLDGIIAVSDVPTKYIREFSDRKIHIVPNGIDLNNFNRRKRPLGKYLDGKINILFLGRMDRRKGAIYLVKAFRKLKKKVPNTRLILGGAGDELKSIKEYIKRYSIEDVVVLGFVDETLKPRLYATCDFFCSPALYGESLGIVLLEAMATGKPVIGGDNPGYRTVLKGTGSLFLVKPQRTDDFVEKLEILSTNKPLRNVMGEWGVEESRKYSWPKVADGVLDVYEKVLSTKKRGKLVDKKSVNENLQKWYKQLDKK